MSMRLFFSRMNQSRNGREIIAEAIKDLVRLSGMPVADVAKMAGISRQHMYRAMKGDKNISIGLIERLFEVCGSNFGQWLSQRSSQGKDRLTHERLQYVLDAGGHHAITAKTCVNAWFRDLPAPKSNIQP